MCLHALAIRAFRNADGVLSSPPAVRKIKGFIHCTTNLFPLCAAFRQKQPGREHRDGCCWEPIVMGIQSSAYWLAMDFCSDSYKRLENELLNNPVPIYLTSGLFCVNSEVVGRVPVTNTALCCPIRAASI